MIKAQLIAHSRDMLTVNQFYFFCESIEDIVIAENVLYVKNTENRQYIFPWELVSSLAMELDWIDDGL